MRELEENRKGHRNRVKVSAGEYKGRAFGVGLSGGRLTAYLPACDHAPLLNGTIRASELLREESITVSIGTVGEYVLASSIFSPRLIKSVSTPGPNLFPPKSLCVTPSPIDPTTRLCRSL